MSQTEDLQLELDLLLCKQYSDKLSELCGYFQAKDPIYGKSRSELVNILRKDVEDTLSTVDDNFDVLIFLKDDIPKVNGTPPPLKRSEEELIVQMEVVTIETKFEELRHLQKE